MMYMNPPTSLLLLTVFLRLRDSVWMTAKYPLPQITALDPNAFRADVPLYWLIYDGELNQAAFPLVSFHTLETRQDHYHESFLADDLQLKKYVSFHCIDISRMWPVSQDQTLFNVAGFDIFVNQYNAVDGEYNNADGNSCAFTSLHRGGLPKVIKDFILKYVI